MEKRIILEGRGRKANQITDLNLDNCRSTSIVGLTDEYTALESLSLINVGLTTLKGFPKLPNLKKLELSDNRISSGLNYLHTSPRLQYLNLCANKIKDLETIKPLQEFKNLFWLDLFSNEIMQVENYREKIFEMLPSLKVLDGYDCNDVEPSSEEEAEGNGNDLEDDDKQNVFCLNGLEIDLNELEEFEKRIKAKRKLQEHNEHHEHNDNNNSKQSIVNADDAVADDDEDDLDVYLKQLQLKEQLSNNSGDAATSTNTIATPPEHEQQMQMQTPAQAQQETTLMVDASSQSTLQNFVLFLYWFLAILNLANAAYYSEVVDEDEVDDDEDEFDSSVSLDEVYNDDLEDDNSEWDEEGEDFDEDVDDSDDEDGDADADASTANNESTASKKGPSADAAEGAPAAAAASTTGKESTAGKVGKKDGKESAKEKEVVNNAAPAAEDKNSEAAGEESQARGKKRKHDG